MTELRPKSSAPTNGQRFLARTTLRNRWRIAWWGKHDHVPLYGFVMEENPGDPDCFEVTNCEFDVWKPLKSSQAKKDA